MKKADHFATLVPQLLSRRGFLKSVSALGASATLPACAVNPDKTRSSSLGFVEVEHGLDDTLSVSPGYKAETLIGWGDPIFDGLAPFDPSKQSEAEQLKRFGYNNDYIGYVPLPPGSASSDHGLLVVNHEYTLPNLMFPGSPASNSLNEEQVAIDIAAHGLSIVEIEHKGQSWQTVLGSKYNRRITPNTPMRLVGSAAGSERLQTAISADGIHTLGTYGNCAGGVTPWGTILTGEENVDNYFSGDYKATPEAENYDRFGMDGRWKNWGEHHHRWNMNKSPREPLHVGWIVEIDPYNPDSTPKKLTGLGRFKHEGCNVYVNSDSRIVAYTGDDQSDEYVYKFVSKNAYQPENREANLSLLDEGTLYVAQFEANGVLNWLPLIYGQGAITSANGFNSQADVSLDCRKAADLVGATPMDRPEDVDVNPVNGRVYVMLTKNPRRQPEQTHPANPRSFNTSGQIVEFWPENGDHASSIFRWDMFLLAGNPNETVTSYHPDISENGWLACPDNCAFDSLGNIWIATDGAEDHGVADGIWASEVSGRHRGLTKRFLRTPIGAELCGPFFTPNDESLFVSVQHPGSGSSFDSPATRWPDFDPTMPPRPSVVVITKEDGGRVGS